MPLGLAGCLSTHPVSRGNGTPPASLAGELHASVDMLATKIGQRNCYHPREMKRAADWIRAELRKDGYAVRQERFRLDGRRFQCADQQVSNVVAELKGNGKSDEIVIVGAHYDSRAGFDGWHEHAPVRPTKPGTPGANDNGSGVAATLALARLLAGHPQDRTIRFCLWANEEPPFYETQDIDAMGSYVMAGRSRAKGEKIAAAVAFDTIGCFSRQPRSKRGVVPGFVLDLVGLPEKPDYIAFVTTAPNGALARRSADVFSRQVSRPVRSLALPYLGRKVAWSDDWSYARFGYPSFCVTDTAYLRSDHYHERGDTPETLDYRPFSEVVWGMRGVIKALAAAR